MLHRQVATPRRPQSFALAALAFGAIVVVAVPKLAGPLSMPAARTVPASPPAQVLRSAPINMLAPSHSTGTYVTTDLVGNASPAEVQQVAAQADRLAESRCATGGAYVTGDLAGDASPAHIYAALCGNPSATFDR